MLAVPSPGPGVPNLSLGAEPTQASAPWDRWSNRALIGAVRARAIRGPIVELIERLGVDGARRLLERFGLPGCYADALGAHPVGALYEFVTCSQPAGDLSNAP